MSTTPKKEKPTVRELRDARIAQLAHSALPWKPYRVTQRFWVNLLDTDDFELAEIIETLKALGDFTSTVKRGIRIVAALDAGRADVLFDLFPWILERLNKNIEAIISKHTRPLEAKIELLQMQLEEKSVGIALSAPTKPLVKIDASQLVVDESTNDDLWDDLADSLGSF